MTTLLERSWERIFLFLEQNFPALCESLQPPATVEDIEALEEAMGLTLPADISALLLCCNGSDESYVLGRWYLMGAEYILQEWRLNQQIAAENEFYEWDPAWLPVLGDGAGNFVVVHAETGECLGADNDPYEREVIAPSLGHWMASMADRLEHGEYRVIEDGEMFELIQDEE